MRVQGRQHREDEKEEAPFAEDAQRAGRRRRGVERSTPERPQREAGRTGGRPVVWGRSTRSLELRLDFRAGSRSKPTSARSANAAGLRRPRPSRGIRGSPSSPRLTSRASSATPRTSRRLCCTGGIATPPHHLASTRANLASATPRNKFDRLLSEFARVPRPPAQVGRRLGSVARRRRLEQ